VQNLIYFLQRYYTFFLFLLLEIVSFFFLIRHNHYQNAVGNDMLVDATGRVYQMRKDITTYFTLREVNDKLLAENSYLRTYQKSSFEAVINDTVTVNDTFYRQIYQYIPARVVNNSVSRRNNYLTLNRGREDGISKDMGVICDDGVVGIVYNVSDHYCTVRSLLNSTVVISPKISDNNYFGSLRWDGDDPHYAYLREVNKHAPIKKGQKVVTSSFSPIFPENISIGTVEEAEVRGGDNFWFIKVKLSTNFGNLSSVYIIKNLRKQEIEELESNTKEN
jgi:rod shape-determining protein MreC